MGFSRHYCSTKRGHFHVSRIHHMPSTIQRRSHLLILHCQSIKQLLLFFQLYHLGTGQKYMRNSKRRGSIQMVLLVPDNRILLTTRHKTGLKISCLYSGDYCSLTVLNQDPGKIDWALSLGCSHPRICGGGSHS